MNIRSILIFLILVGMWGFACSSSGGDGDASTASDVLVECPNIGTSGQGAAGAACGSSSECECGLTCSGGACSAFTGEYTDCSCGPDINECSKPAPSGAPCNPYCQIGCTEEQQCSYLGFGFGCTGIGEREIGAVCTDSSDCVEGMACLKINNETVETCRLFCKGDSDCPSDRKCNLNITWNSGQANQTSVSFCGEPTVGCNPFDDPLTACGDGEGCYYESQATACKPAGTIPLGEVCYKDPTDRCEPGLQCLVRCVDVCSSNDGNADNPKCSSECPGEIIELSAENGLGTCMPDGPYTMCNIFTQEGCAPTEGCYSVTGGHACITAGTIEIGESCTYTNDCVPGAGCVNSQCQLLCNAAEDAPTEESCDERCEEMSFLTPQSWGVGLCVDAEPAVPCDFWQQDCEPGTFCYYVSNGATCLEPNNQNAEGEACQYIRDCAQGLVCASDTGTCVQPCSILEAVPPGVPVCATVCDPAGGFKPISSSNPVGCCTDAVNKKCM
ncbi:MAG: hypothetical protein CMH54_09495 [Myxococcales bacterium]|nr:hypothetical protein [Myxococcales bacterium]